MTLPSGRELEKWTWHPTLVTMGGGDEGSPAVLGWGPCDHCCPPHHALADGGSTDLQNTQSSLMEGEKTGLRGVQPEAGLKPCLGGCLGMAELSCPPSPILSSTLAGVSNQLKMDSISPRAHQTKATH